MYAILYWLVAFLAAFFFAFKHILNMSYKRAGLILGIPFGILALFFAIVFGATMPLEAIPAWVEVHTVTAHLRVGEPRAQFERSLGSMLPRPSRERTAGPYDVAYYFAAGEMICMRSFLGVVVQYDPHERVQSWTRSKYEESLMCL